MFAAQLDTCVLVPSLVRDVLLEIAERGVYQPLWSSQILDELARTVRTLLAKRGHDDTTIETYVSRLVNQMETAFPDAKVDDWETLVPTIELPDPDDRHVVAAAVRGRATSSSLTTWALRSFPWVWSGLDAPVGGRIGPCATLSCTAICWGWWLRGRWIGSSCR